MSIYFYGAMRLLFLIQAPPTGKDLYSALDVHNANIDQVNKLQ